MKKNEVWLETDLEITEALHLRPIQTLSLTAQKFESRVNAVAGDRFCNVKSFLEMLEFGALVTGAGLKRFSIHACGPDAKRAIDAIMELKTTVPEFTPQESVAKEQK